MKPITFFSLFLLFGGQLISEANPLGEMSSIHFHAKDLLAFHTPEKVLEADVELKTFGDPVAWRGEWPLKLAHAKRRVNAAIQWTTAHRNYWDQVRSYQRSFDGRLPEPSIDFSHPINRNRALEQGHSILQNAWHKILKKNKLPLKVSSAEDRRTHDFIHQLTIHLCGQENNVLCLRYFETFYHQKASAQLNAQVALELGRHAETFREFVAGRKKAFKILNQLGFPKEAQKLRFENQLISIRYQLLHNLAYLSKLIYENLDHEIESPNFEKALNGATERTMEEYLEVWDYDEEGMRSTKVAASRMGTPYYRTWHDSLQLGSFLWNGVVNWVSFQNYRRVMSELNDSIYTNILGDLDPEIRDIVTYGKDRALENSLLTALNPSNMGLSMNLLRDIRVQARELMRFNKLMMSLLQVMEAQTLPAEQAIDKLTPKVLPADQTSRLAAAVIKRFRGSSFFRQVTTDSDRVGFPEYEFYVKEEHGRSVADSKSFVSLKDMGMISSQTLNVVEPGMLNEAAKFLTGFNIWMVAIFPFQVESFIVRMGHSLAHSMQKNAALQTWAWRAIQGRHPQRLGRTSFDKMFKAPKTGRINGEKVMEWLSGPEILYILEKSKVAQNLNLMQLAYLRHFFPFIMKTVHKVSSSGQLPTWAITGMTVFLVETADGCTARYGYMIYDLVKTWMHGGENDLKTLSPEKAIAAIGEDPFKELANMWKLRKGTDE